MCIHNDTVLFQDIFIVWKTSIWSIPSYTELQVFWVSLRHPPVWSGPRWCGSIGRPRVIVSREQSNSQAFASLEGVKQTSKASIELSTLLYNLVCIAGLNLNMQAVRGHDIDGQPKNCNFQQCLTDVFNKEILGSRCFTSHILLYHKSCINETLHAGQNWVN